MNFKFTLLLLVLTTGMLHKGYAQPSSCDNDPLARPRIVATNNGVVCGSNPITLTCASQLGGPIGNWTHIQWFVNGSLMSQTTTSITVTGPGGTYVVRGANNECMTVTQYESAPFTVTGSAVNSVSITGFLSVVPGGTTSLSATTGGPGITYSWSNGATTQSTIVGAGTYTVTVSDGSGCSNSATVTVTENPGCVPNVSVTNGGIICNGAPITMSVTNASNFSSFQWYISAPDTQPVGTAPDYITSQPGTYFAGVVHPACGPVNSSGVVITASSITASIAGNLIVPTGGITTLTSSPAGSGISYAWSNGSTGQSIIVGAGTYTVTVTNAQGCSDAETVTVTETIGCSPTISTSGSNICNDDPVILSVNNPSNFTSFQWFQNGNPLSGATNSTYTATAAGSYHVVVTSGCGAASSSPVSITSSNVTAGITGNLSIASGGTTTLTATPASLAYSWSTGSTSQSVTVAAGTYTVTVTNAQGCSDAETVTVIENTGCTPAISSGGGVICNSNPVNLIVTNASSFNTFQWTLNGNPIPGATSLSYSATAGGLYNVSANSTTCGPVVSTPVNIIESSITATISGNLTIPVGGTTTLTASPQTPSPGGVTYSWSTGATTPSVTVIAGIYSVTLTNGRGCRDTETVIVTESATCTPSVNSTSSVICNGNAVTLSVSNAANFTSFQWNLNGNPISGATNSSYTASSGGSYTVIANSASCGNGTSSAVVLSVSTITASINGNLTVPTGGTTTLTATPGSMTYIWSTGATGQSVTVGSGTYTVTVTNAQGCSDAETVTVTENAACTPTISAGGGIICNSNPVSLAVNNPSNFSSFQWYRDGNIIAGATSSSYQASIAGSYHVVTNSGCGSVSSSPVPIGASTITAIISGGLTVPSGGTTTLTASPSGMSYSWSNGSNAASVTVGAGTYTVTVTDAQGCSDAATVTVATGNVVCNPPTISASASTICNGNPVTLTLDNPSEFATVSWYRDGNWIGSGVVSAFQSYDATIPGTYYVNAGSANASCGSSNSPSIVLVNSSITASINGNLTVPTGGTTTLTATPGGMTYLWSTGATTQSLNVGSGTYTVTVTNTQGCSDVETVTVTESSTCSPVINSSGTAICNGTSVTLTVANAASFTSFQWSLNGNTISGATGSSYLAMQAGSYTVTANSATCGTVTSVATTLTTSSVTASVTGNLNVPVGGTTTLTAMPAGLTYNWSTGSIAQSVSVGAGTYTVTVTNAEGCNDIETVTVTENAACSPALSTTAGVICNNNQVTISVVNASSFASFQWYKDGTAITGASGSSYSTNTPGSYSVQASSASCGTINSSPLIIGTSNITAAITGNLSILPGGTTTLTASPGGMTYLWSTGATSQTITVGAGTYTVTVTNAQGCSDNETVTVVENSGCSPIVSASDNVICNGNAITLTVTNASSFTSFQWYLDGNPISGATSSTYSASAAGSYYVTVTAASCGSGNSTPIPISASNISASISGNTSIPVGGTTTLTALPAGMTYLWNNGTSTQSISVGAGTYSVTVTNPEGCFATASVTVTESGSCTITVATSSGGIICNGNPVNLSVSNPAGLSSFQWQLNGNNITGATASTYAASTAGSYTVSANSATCGNTTSSPVNVTSSAVAASISVTANGGGSITLTASPAGMSYLWVPDGQITQSITETPTASKTYTVTVTNVQGCSSSATYTYNYNGGTGPHIITASSSTSFCEGGSVVLMGPTGYTSYLWDPGNATTQSISIAPSVGTYVYGLTAINTNTNTIEYDTIHVTVNPKPTIGINAIDNGNGTWTLTATPPGLSYQWSTGATTPSITVSAIGTYTVTGTTSAGCSAQASHQVTCIITAPVVTAQGPTSWCGSGSVQLTGSVAGSVTGWQWYKNGVLIAGATGVNYSATASGNYTVEIITACGNKMSNVVSVMTGNYPTGDFTITGSPAIYGGRISFTATVNGANDYTWYFGDGQLALNAGPTADHYYYLAGTMTVRLVAVDAGGCELIIEKTVVVAEDHVIDTAGSSGNYKLNIFPNPYRDKLYITFMLTSDAKVVLDIANPSGRIIRRVEFNGRAGSNKFLVPDAGLLNSNVTYLFRVSINGKKYSDKILKY